jgi:2-iminobutanoate/2-iminopropanoate deaminase
MSNQKIETANAPSAVGPYSQGIKRNDFVFISGQVPYDVGAGAMCNGSVTDQTRCALQNVQAIAEAAGTNLSKAVKITVFLTDINDFAEVNAEYEKFFPEVAPARSCFAVVALPKGAKLEIEAICAE